MRKLRKFDGTPHEHGRASMKQTKWIRGALLVAAMAGCQSNTNTGDPKDDSGSTQDISDALAQLPEAEVLMYSADGLPQYIVGDLGRIEAAQDTGLIATDHTLRAALPPILKAFRLENKDLILRKVNTDEQGARHYRYKQTFNGLDVVGSELVVHVDAKGSIAGINGTARGDISPTLGASSIRVDAANLNIEADPRWSGVKARSITGSRVVYVEAADGSRHKAFEQIVEGVRGQDPVRDKVFVNVEDGAIVAVHPQIQHARNRLTYSANNGTTLPGTLKRTETQGPVGDTAVDKAHDSTLDVYDAYKLFFNRDSIDNAGMNLISTVHYSTNYCNAFWNSSQMTYGDGNVSQNCLPLANSVDVAGHEITHGVTERESNLTYSGESGGLNESYSDIFGGFTEAYRLGGRDGTLSLDPKVFLIGDEVLPPFLRNMCDPAADSASADVWSSGLGGIDVHYSSGPNNLVFCLLTKGGMHPRGKTTNLVPSIGMDKTVRIFYKANVDLLTASSNYAAMRTAMVQAASQLGYDQATQDAVACAYAAIKVGTLPAACGGVPPPPDGVLTNDVPQTNLTDTVVGNMKFWKLDVPAGQSTLTFTISGGTGDVDMYVQLGAHPSETVYQCRPYLSGNAETCTFTPPSAGTYYVGLRAYAAYSGVTLRGTFGGSTGGDPYLSNGVPVAGLAGATSSAKYYRIAVPAGRNLVVKISGGSGDADLYTRFGARPTTATYACRPYAAGNTETCTHNAAAVGDWYVMVRGFAAYSGLTLVGSF
jgi:vibriolysin